MCLKEVIWRFYQCSERLWVQHTIRRSLQNHYNQSIWCFYHPVSSILPPSAILKTSSLSFSQSSYHNCRTAIRLSKSFPWTLSLKTWKHDDVISRCQKEKFSPSAMTKAVIVNIQTVARSFDLIISAARHIFRLQSGNFCLIWVWVLTIFTVMYSLSGDTHSSIAFSILSLFIDQVSNKLVQPYYLITLLSHRSVVLQ